MIPTPYRWLLGEPGPRHLVVAVGLIGTKEKVGPAHNPEILRWARELKAASVFPTDEVPWCGLFVAWCMRQANRSAPEHFYRALTWAGWTGGQKAEGGPQLGDVLVFQRSGGGHVGFYVGEDATAYHVLGGNQGNAVSITRIAKARCTAIRWPAGVPLPSTGRVLLSSGAPVSRNEA